MNFLFEKLTFLSPQKNISCGYSKETSQRDGSFKPPKQMLKLLDKKLFYNLFYAGIFGLLFYARIFGLCGKITA